MEAVAILLPRAVRVYFATAPVNLRKSFDGLSNEVRSVLGHDPLAGHVFVFICARHERWIHRSGECCVDSGNSTESATEEQRGPVLEVLAQLLAEGRNEALVALVTKLLARHSERDLRLARLLGRKQKSERVSSAELLVLFEALKAEGSKDLDEANERLRAASGLDAKHNQDQEPRTEKPKPQSPVRRPIPDHLRRIDNLILVPDDQRPCLLCTVERPCIGCD